MLRDPIQRHAEPGPRRTRRGAVSVAAAVALVAVTACGDDDVDDPDGAVDLGAEIGALREAIDDRVEEVRERLRGLDGEDLRESVDDLRAEIRDALPEDLDDDARQTLEDLRAEIDALDIGELGEDARDAVNDLRDEIEQLLGG